MLLTMEPRRLMALPDGLRHRHPGYSSLGTSFRMPCKRAAEALEAELPLAGEGWWGTAGLTAKASNQRRGAEPGRQRCLSPGHPRP